MRRAREVPTVSWYRLLDYCLLSRRWGYGKYTLNSVELYLGLFCSRREIWGD